MFTLLGGLIPRQAINHFSTAETAQMGKSRKNLNQTNPMRVWTVVQINYVKIIYFLVFLIFIFLHYSFQQWVSLVECFSGAIKGMKDV